MVLFIKKPKWTVSFYQNNNDNAMIVFYFYDDKFFENMIV